MKIEHHSILSIVTTETTLRREKLQRLYQTIGWEDYIMAVHGLKKHYLVDANIIESGDKPELDMIGLFDVKPTALSWIALRQGT
jgi:hypothetical protein